MGEPQPEEGGSVEANASTKDKICSSKVWIDNVLIILIILAVLIGFGMGVGLKDTWSHEDYKNIFYLEFPGRIFINMLKMLILPLIISSLITGMASIGSHASGKLGAAAVIYYMTTTLIAVIIGIILVLSIHPGEPTEKDTLTRAGSSKDVDALESFLDLISQCFPENLVTACFERKTTTRSLVKSERFNKTDNSTYEVFIEKPVLETSKGTNVLGLVVFSIALGIVINRLGDEGKPLRDFFHALNAATMVLISVVIWFTPIGILFLIAAKVVSTDDLLEVLEGLGKYIGTVLGGLCIHGFVVLPLLYFILTRKNPIKFAGNMLKALITAFGTASSSATLPLTMDCLAFRNKINLNIVRFVAPVGATINMDGTALYEAVACIYIAQLNDMDLSVADVIIVSLTATAAAIGAAGVPQAGLVTLVIVLTSVGLPAEDVTLILAIDWLLDRFRTAVNVWGDSVGAGILDHFFGKYFPSDNPMDMESDVTEGSIANASSVQGEEKPPSYQSYQADNDSIENENANTKL